MSSRTTTKKSLCSIESTCIWQKEGCFRSFLFQHVTFWSVFPLSPLFLSPRFLFCFFFFSSAFLFPLSISLCFFPPSSSLLITLVNNSRVCFLSLSVTVYCFPSIFLHPLLSVFCLSILQHPQHLPISLSPNEPFSHWVFGMNCRPLIKCQSLMH